MLSILNNYYQKMRYFAKIKLPVNKPINMYIIFCKRESKVFGINS